LAVESQLAETEKRLAKEEKRLLQRDEERWENVGQRLAAAEGAATGVELALQQVFLASPLIWRCRSHSYSSPCLGKFSLFFNIAVSLFLILL
jgi:hypothetical protein